MDENIQSLYQNLYNTYGISPEAVKARDSSQQEMRFTHLLSVSELKKDDSVLDVGCGSGEFLKYLRGLNYNGEYCGIDFVEDFITYGNKKFKNDSNVSFVTKILQLMNLKLIMIGYFFLVYLMTVEKILIVFFMRQ